MLKAVPATGPSGMFWSTSAPHMYRGRRAPRRLLVAKSILALWDRPTRVTTEVGSRLATPAIDDINPPPRTSARLATIAWCSWRNRSAGADDKADVQRLHRDLTLVVVGQCADHRTGHEERVDRAVESLRGRLRRIERNAQRLEVPVPRTLDPKW